MSAGSRRRWRPLAVLLIAIAAAVWPGLTLLDRAYGDERGAQGVSGNDDFANAWSIAGLPFIGEQDTTAMTVEAGEPLRPDGCIAGSTAEKGATVWYRYTPQASGPITASTGGSTYDTVLAVYTGSSVGSLTPIACNDDAIGVQSRVTFNGDAAVTYYIQVGGYQAEVGDLRLLVQVATSPPPTPTPSSTQTRTPTPTPTTTPLAGPGDASCDGSVTALDALLVLQFVAQLLPALPCQGAADVDGSGAVSAIDATIILQFVAGLIPAL